MVSDSEANKKKLSLTQQMAANLRANTRSAASYGMRKAKELGANVVRNAQERAQQEKELRALETQAYVGARKAQAAERGILRAQRELQNVREGKTGMQGFGGLDLIGLGQQPEKGSRSQQSESPIHYVDVVGLGPQRQKGGRSQQSEPPIHYVDLLGFKKPQSTPKKPQKSSQAGSPVYHLHFGDARSQARHKKRRHG